MHRKAHCCVKKKPFYDKVHTKAVKTRGPLSKLPTLATVHCDKKAILILNFKLGVANQFNI